MAVTAAGTPYVETSDLVANYPGVSLALANHIDDVSTILQVVSTTKTDTFSTTSTTFADVTGVSVSITPSSTTNKILVFVNVQIGSSGAGPITGINLMRGSTSISLGDAAGSRSRGAAAIRIDDQASMASIGINFLDSPATTSSTTYKIQMKTSSGTSYVNRSGEDGDLAGFLRTASTITVMEVSA